MKCMHMDGTGSVSNTKKEDHYCVNVRTQHPALLQREKNVG